MTEIDLYQFRNKTEAVEALIAERDDIKSTKDADAYIREHVPKESYFQTKIMERIRKLVPAAFIWKAAAGPYSVQGIPDICAVIHGRYYGFEVKRPLLGRPSIMQIRTIQLIKEAGGKAYIVSMPDEVEEILKSEGELTQ